MAGYRVTFTFTVLRFMYEYNYLVGRDNMQPGRDTPDRLQTPIASFGRVDVNTLRHVTCDAVTSDLPLRDLQSSLSHSSITARACNLLSTLTVLCNQ
jgi:hypothetical protein